MNPRFNLIDEPWIPLRASDGRMVEAGLKEALCRAHEFAALAEPNPPNFAALYRLLLALASRSLADEEWDPARWWHEGLPRTAIEGYLEKWRDRFWAFHDTCPFMQVAALATAPETRDRVKPWTQLALDRSSGDTPLVFDHTLDDSPPRSSIGAVVRSMLGLLQFTPGGLVKVLKTSDTAGPLANTAAVIPVGERLHQGLLLGLHEAEDGDLPAWEREAPTIDQITGSATLPCGPNDLYTRQTRAVLLLPDEEDENGVRWVRYGAGLSLESNPSQPEPMAAFIQGKTSRYPLSFREGRAFWRDLPSLLPDPGGNQDLHPRILDDARAMLDAVGDDIHAVSIVAAGLASNQAKLLRWGMASFKLPRKILDGVSSAAAELRKLVDEAEETGSVLIKLSYSAVRQAFPRVAEGGAFARALPTSQVYYAHLECQVPRVLVLLAEDEIEKASAAWTMARIEAAKRAWRATRAALGDSLPVIRAMAKVEPGFGRLLGSLGKALGERQPASNETQETKRIEENVA